MDCNPNQEVNYRLGRVMIGDLVANKWSQLTRSHEELAAAAISTGST